MKIPDDDELITRALYYWANYIETGEVELSAVDLKNMGVPNKKVLDEYQTRVVLRLRDLASKY